MEQFEAYETTAAEKLAYEIITILLFYCFRSTEKFTAIVLAFIVDKRESIEDFDVSSEYVKSKLTSLLNHTKILVGGPWRKVIIDIPKFLSVGTPIRLMNSSIVNSMIEIFAKRYHEMDLVSMLRELVRKIGIFVTMRQQYLEKMTLVTQSFARIYCHAWIISCGKGSSSFNEI